MNGKVFRITPADIERLKNHCGPGRLVDAYVNWLPFVGELDTLIDQLENSFAGFKLEDGTGLFEAAGIDDYASPNELANLRAQDEKLDWRRISSDKLRRCYAAPTFMNARGFAFHLPAFLIASLNDDDGFGFPNRLLDNGLGSPAWMALLNQSQRNAISDILKVLAHHPEYAAKSHMIESIVHQLHNDG